ncbi:MAG: RNA recognition motif domain-containing protein [Aestuariibacter sp.]
MNFSLKSIIATIAVALIGYLVIAFGNITLAPEIAFAVAAVVTGIVLQLGFVESESDFQADEDVEVTTLYIGNLPYKVSEDAIRDHFANLGYVQSVRLMRDRKTGKRKGFGFVEVASNDAEKMVDKLNDTEFEERTLKVRFAKEKHA